jgi:DNA-binding IclR family transcriptional regulator
MCYFNATMRFFAPRGLHEDFMSAPKAASASAEEKGSSGRSRVSGIDRALQVLDYLYETNEPAAPYAMAKFLRLPLSTAYPLIESLVERNILTRREDGKIWFGARLYHYGLSYAASLDFLELAKQQMQALSDEVGETVQVCTREGDNMLVAGMVEGKGHFHVSSRVGSRIPLNWTASGRLLLGHLPEKERITLFKRAAKASHTGRADTDAGHLARVAAEAFQNRLSIQIGESDYAVACVASPICDASGACVATISIVLPEQRVRENQDYYANAVKQASLRIEAALAR